MTDQDEKQEAIAGVGMMVAAFTDEEAGEEALKALKQARKDRQIHFEEAATEEVAEVVVAAMAVEGEAMAEAAEALELAEEIKAAAAVEALRALYIASVIDEMVAKEARAAMLAHANSGHAPWYLVDANVKRHARLNVISHLLSLSSYEDLTPKPMKLPPRQKSITYQHPEMAGYSHVPKRYP